MKLALGFILVGLFPYWLAAQHEYEPSKTHPYGQPHPDAPAAVQDFQAMIGLCDCESFQRKPDGTWAEPVDMTWEFKYILNGWGVQDQTLKADGAHSGSLRQYSADSSSWYVHYYSSNNPTPQLATWEGGKKGDEIVLYRAQKSPNGMNGFYKIRFHDMSDNGYNWTGAWVSVDESVVYPTWKIECKKRKGKNKG